AHADFGIAGGRNEGIVYSRGEPLRKVPTEQLVDTLFAEIDRYATSKRVDVDASKAAEAAEWLERIEAEHAGELTPERLAAMEAAAVADENDAAERELAGRLGSHPARLDEGQSPVAGRRFTRA